MVRSRGICKIQIGITILIGIMFCFPISEQQINHKSEINKEQRDTFTLKKGTHISDNTIEENQLGKYHSPNFQNPNEQPAKSNYRSHILTREEVENMTGCCKNPNEK